MLDDHSQNLFYIGWQSTKWHELSDLESFPPGCTSGIGANCGQQPQHGLHALGAFGRSQSFLGLCKHIQIPSTHAGYDISHGRQTRNPSKQFFRHVCGNWAAVCFVDASETIQNGLARLQTIVTGVGIIAVGAQAQSHGTYKHGVYCEIVHVACCQSPCRHR